MESEFLCCLLFLATKFFPKTWMLFYTLMDQKQGTLLSQQDIFAALDRRKASPMNAVLSVNNSPTCDLGNEQTWADLICLLRVRIRRFVYSARVASWQGQREDIIEDV